MACGRLCATDEIGLNLRDYELDILRGRAHTSSMPRFHATYKDDRDPDESAIFEGDSIDDCVDAVVRYFRNVPASLDHMEYWRVVDASQPERDCLRLTTIDLT